MIIGKSYNEKENIENENFIKIKNLQTPRRVFVWFPKRLCGDGRYVWLQFAWRFALISFVSKEILAWNYFLTYDKCVEGYDSCVQKYLIKF